MEVNPSFAGDQVVPLLPERKIPAAVPAIRVDPFTASARTIELPSPELTGVQFPPAFVERYTPPGCTGDPG
jgi:hypothetical protein